LAPGVVHYHFASKEEILLALVRDLTAVAEARYRARSAAAETARARLHAFVDGQLALDETTDPRAAAAWAAIGAEAARHRSVGRVYRQTIDVALTELGALFAAALPRRHRARSSTYAASTLAAIEGFFHLAFAAPNALAEGSAATTVNVLVDALLERT